MNKEALLYKKEAGNAVRCLLCSHRCLIGDGRRGLCGVRQNSGGTLESLVYGFVIAENADPIEKKPLFHFLPGTRSYSIATVGCNFRCLFCQNHDISQLPAEEGRIVGRSRRPEHIVEQALAAGCRSISYTYTEPTVYFELAYETALLARRKGLRNVLVTNGYMTGEMLELFAPYLDAANVDLKAFRDDFYRQRCGARLQPVLETLQAMKGLGVWVEVTTLLIPGMNDTAEELRDLAHFIFLLGPETPWHVSRFHPRYRLTDKPPTPAAAIQLAGRIGREEGLRYVYSGNLPGDPGENTYCPRCSRILIKRYGFVIEEMAVREGSCPACGEKVAGVFS